MAVVKVPQNSKLLLKVQIDVSATDKPVLRQRTFANVKSDALDSDVFAVAESLASLQKHALVDIIRQDMGNIINQ